MAAVPSSAMVGRARLLMLLAALAVGLAACGGAPQVDVVADAGDAAAPPRDAHLADAGYPETAAWIRDVVQDEGRPVIVKFFASWCEPCAEEAPVLLSAAQANPEVAVLGVDHQDWPDAAEAWVTEHGFDAIPTVADVEGEVARALGARGMPSVSFVDGDGRLLATHTGPIDPGLLDAWIDHMVRGGPRPAARPDAPATDTPS